MPLTLQLIKDSLAKSSWSQKDNTARKLIDDATTAEIKSLDHEAILRLYEVISEVGKFGFYSAEDKAAINRLLCNTQYNKSGVSLESIIKTLKSTFSGTVAARVINAKLINNLYAAEKKRLSWYENKGFDDAASNVGDRMNHKRLSNITKGPGQVGQASYVDIQTKLAAPWKKHYTHVVIMHLLSGTAPFLIPPSVDFTNYKIKIPNKFISQIYNNKNLDNFVVAAYLCLCINGSQRNNRSDIDTLKFGIGIYHGMYTMMYAEQKKFKSEDVNWAPVEAALIATKDEKKVDAVNYINEVMKDYK